MDIKEYTNNQYIPMTDLSSFGDIFIAETLKYRRKFMEVIPLDELEFVNIVETPQLVRKRYAKNVEIKEMMDIEAPNYDYILAIAKKIVLGENILKLDKKVSDSLNNKYKDNKNDLTIITNWLVMNVDKILKNKIETISFDIPELSKNDMKFINKYNKINQNYSINEYINLIKCSYETGRRALEKLTNLKLYVKTKLGKKFVYKPTNKLIQIKKGGNYGN